MGIKRKEEKKKKSLGIKCRNGGFSHRHGSGGSAPSDDGKPKKCIGAKPQKGMCYYEKVNKK